MIGLANPYWLASGQATACPDFSVEELAHLVADAQISGNWLPDLFLPDPPAMHEYRMVGGTQPYLIEIKETSMQHALVVSVAESMPTGPASTDTILVRSPVSHKRYRCLRYPLSLVPRTHFKHAPPDLISAGAVAVSFVKSTDTESARRFLDAVSLLRQWGRESRSTFASAALEAVAS